MNFIPSLSFQKFIHFFQPSAILAHSMNTVVNMIIETKKNNWNIFCKTVSFFFFKKPIACETLHFPMQCNYKVVFEFQFIRFFDCVTAVLQKKIIHSKTFDWFTISYAKLIFVTWETGKVWILRCKVHFEECGSSCVIKHKQMHRKFSMFEVMTSKKEIICICICGTFMKQL